MRFYNLFLPILAMQFVKRYNLLLKGHGQQVLTPYFILWCNVIELSHVAFKQ